MLGSIDQMRLVSAAADDSFLAHLEQAPASKETGDLDKKIQAALKKKIKA